MFTLMHNNHSGFRHHVYKLKLNHHKYQHLPQMDADEKHPCVHRPNNFRHACLYNRSVALVCNKYNKFLMGMFVYYSTDTGRKNELAIVDWFNFIKDASIIDQDSSERDILLCFCYSRMRVKNEMHLRKRVTKLTYNEFVESLVRIAMVKSLVVYALMIKGTLDPHQKIEPADKWWDAGFKPDCEAVDRLAGQGTVPMWREEDAGDRLELLILGIRYVFETLRGWNLNSKFGRLSSKQVKVLESRETKNAKYAPKGMKKYQCFDKETGKCLFDQTETKYVKGITLSMNSGAKLIGAFGAKHKQHVNALKGKSSSKWKKVKKP